MATQTNVKTFKFDVFISHSSRDRDAVRELAVRLKSDGLRVWFDEWVIRPGDLTGKKVDDGLKSSHVLLLAMSQSAFASEWATLESGTFRFRDPTNKDRRFIPILLEDVELPSALRQFSYIDWRHRSETEYDRLVEACRPAEAEPENKPTASDYASRVASMYGHQGRIFSVTLTADGKRAVSGSIDHVVRVWNVSNGTCEDILTGHKGSVFAVAMTPDGRRLISASEDKTLRVWDLSSGKCLAVLDDHRAGVTAVAISWDGKWAISGADDGQILSWNLDDFVSIGTLSGHKESISDLTITSDATRIVSASYDRTLRVWQKQTGECLGVLKGHTGQVNAVIVTAADEFIVSASDDRTLRIWNINTFKCLSKLEGHTGRILSLATAGRIIASGSGDASIRFWNVESGQCLFVSPRLHALVLGLAMSPDGATLISAGGAPPTVIHWRLAFPPEQLGFEPDSGRYTNAKVLLVGESGVGKSALAIRLAYDRFEPATISTDALWATQIKLPYETTDPIDREIWLWDFAGQADYRLIHQLFMDETAVAALVFNPQSEDPFEGLGHWDRDLQRAARRSFRKLLVAGRCDRGGLMVSRKSIEGFRTERGFAEYLETSALRGTGCSELREAIFRNIPWEDIPWTTSPRIFKSLKEEIVKLKDEGKVLLRSAELKQQIEMRTPSEAFTMDQLRAVVALLASAGVVWQLEFGDFVLLQPEKINSYAAAVIRSVRSHSEEIGCIGEERVLAGDLDYQDLQRLPADDEEIVLRAMHQTFVDHGLCLREHTDEGTLLIFPSYFKRERPDMATHPLVLVTYRFNGPLEEIYATLVVRLHHITAFERAQLWRFAADFATPAGKRLGIKMNKKAEGAAELEIYFEAGIANDVQVTFIRYVHEHLNAKAQDVIRIRHYICPHCSTPVENRTAVEKRLEKGQKDIVCGVCEERVDLIDLIEQNFASEEFLDRVRQLEEAAKSSIDNESRELILIGHAYSISGEAGQIYRTYANSDHGIDGEIEFKDYSGRASGKRLYLQLKSGDSYLYKRKGDGEEIFTIKNRRHADYWKQQAYPVMLVVRTSDGAIRWMDVSAHLKRRKRKGEAGLRFAFKGEPFTAFTIQRMRDRYVLAAA